MRDNPLTLIREHCGLSPKQFAAKIHTTENCIRFNEHGLYVAPSPTVLDGLIALAPLSREPIDRFVNGGLKNLTHEYKLWQTEQRIANYGLLNTEFPISLNFKIFKHPFVDWRDMSAMGIGVSAYATCRSFCIHPATLHKFEEQSYLVKEVPKPIINALKESGYSEAVLDKLISEYKLFLKAKRAVA